MQFGDIFGQTLASSSFVTGSTGSTVLLYHAQGARKLCFFNHASASLFLKFGPGASATSFNVKLSSGSYYEVPYPVHTGSYTGIWDAAGGQVCITWL